ncbi:MAG: efflux RND transporter periplasmic adaptor subunit [Phycisphaerales bacterium]|nr:efflux RND transporter periplasmic adaptor subunit [Phycisphaerales bacterium]
MLTAGCGKPAAPAGSRAQAKPIEVEVAPVLRRDIARSIDLTGTLFGQEEVTVSSKLAGRIIRLDHDLGDVVAPGQPLAQIEKTDVELALGERRAAVAASLAKLGLTSLPGDDFDPASLPAIRRARAEEANAQARFERARQLFEQTPPLISAQDFADIRTQSEVASRSAEVEVLTARALIAEARTQTAAVRTAEQLLVDTQVLAPAPPDAPNLIYRVAERRVSVGEMVTPGQALFRLVASDRIKFRGAAPERFAGRVQAGQAATLSIEAFERPFPATVTRISPQIDPATRSFEVEIEAENPDGRLKPGAFARAVVITGTDPGVSFVPAAAVSTFAGVQKVYGVKDSKAVEVRILTGVRDGGFIEVVGGLNLDHVVISSAGGLSNGAPVTVVEPPAAVRASERPTGG